MGTIQIDGSTPKLTIGNATAEDALILFDGAAQDFYIALDDSADDLLIGLGSTVGTTPAIAIDENLKVNIPVTTASTSTSTGSLTTGGGAGIGADLYVGDDAYLITDSAVLGFGADKDTLLTHTDGTGLTLNSTNKLCFNDASQFIQGSSATVLSIGATDEIDLTATAVDLNGTLDVSGTTTLGGTLTVNAGAVFNEASADVDFRIESNNDANCFYLDAGDDEIWIGRSSGWSDAKLQVFSNHSTTNDLIEGFTIGAATTGTAANNVGTKMTWLGSYDGGGEVELGQLGYHNTNVTGVYGDFVIKCRPNASSAERFRVASNGDLTATDTSISSNSDSRLKENISDFTYDLAKFKQLRPRTFDWKNPIQHNNKSNNRGFIAQETKLVDDYWIDEVELSQYVAENPDGSVIEDYTSDRDLIGGNHKAYTSKLGKKDAMYISVINQLIARIEALEA